MRRKAPAKELAGRIPCIPALGDSWAGRGDGKIAPAHIAEGGPARWWRECCKYLPSAEAILEAAPLQNGPSGPIRLKTC